MAIATFVHNGNIINYAAAAAVAAGDVIVQGDLVAVAKEPIAAGALGALAVSGVFDVAKAAGAGTAITAGSKVYWDAANKVATADDDGGANAYLGKVTRDAADADTTVRVRLCP